MTTSKRITTLENYTSVLPYSSEIFGVYQPLIGWKSKRIMKRMNQGIMNDQTSLLNELSKYYDPDAKISFNSDHVAQITELAPGKLASPTLSPQSDSILLSEISKLLTHRPIPEGRQWSDLINFDNLSEILNTKVFPFYRDQALKAIQAIPSPHLPFPVPQNFWQDLWIPFIEANLITSLQKESKYAGELLDLFITFNYSISSSKFFS